MAELIRSKKGQKLDPKAVVFWSIIGAITVALLVSLIVIFVQNLQITNKEKFTYLEGNEIFNCEQEEYFVVVYDFDLETDKTEDEFEKVLLNYLTFLKKYYGNKIEDVEYAHKLYAVDSSAEANYKAIVKDTKESNIDGTTAVTNTFVDSDQLLRIASKDLPTLLVVRDGVIAEHKTGEDAISKYLQEIIDKYK